jgi:exodeoxyribonuclease VII large subunit
VVGLVTSPTGAVLHDIRNIISRRYPLVEVLLAPTQVQGADAVSGIVSALKSLNEDGHSDLIIVARGGGSLEELWAFNEEAVARAIYSSRIPVVSAVGHETDYTISDLVADVRAPTPSAAAELVVPDTVTLRQEIHAHGESILRAMSHHLSTGRHGVDGLAGRLRSHTTDVATLRRQVDDLAQASSKAMSHRLSLWRSHIQGLEMRFEALNPESILYRGYSIVQKCSDGMVVSSKEQVNAGEELRVTLSDGSIPATVGGPTTTKARPKKRMERAGAQLL